MPAYAGEIPVADICIGTMVAGTERRSQGSDYVHEFLRLKAAENSDKMNQVQALGYRTTVESGHGRTRLEANRPAETGAASPP